MGELIYNRAMKRILGPCCLIGSFLLAFGFANAQEKTVKMVPARPTVAIDGKTLFHEYCAVCHGDDGKGGGPAASALKQSPGDLTQIAHKNGGKYPDTLILRIIQGEESVTAHGTQAMPMWGTIFNNMGDPSVAQLRVHALESYIEKMQAK